MSKSRVIHGRWWLAEEPVENAVTGTLTLSEDEYRLDLQGSLHGPSPPPELVGRILGESADRREEVTLEDCGLAKHGPSWKRGSGTTYPEAYRPRIVCLGGWFASEEPLAFDSVHVWLSSLHPWTAVSGFEPMWHASPDASGATARRRTHRHLNEARPWRMDHDQAVVPVAGGDRGSLHLQEDIYAGDEVRLRVPRAA